MKRVLTLSILAAAAVATSATAQQFHEIKLMDPILGISGGTIQVPNGWRFQGSIVEPACSSGRGFPQYSLVSPDGVSSIQVSSPFFTFDAPVSTFKGDISSCGVENVHPPAARTTLQQYILPLATRGRRVTESKRLFDSPATTTKGVGYQVTTDSAGQVLAFGHDPAHLTALLILVTTDILQGKGGFTQGTSTPIFITTTDPKTVPADIDIIKQLKFTMSADWTRRAVARMTQVSQQERDAMDRRAAQSRAALKADGDQKLAAIQANAQQQMQLSAAYARQSIANIRATGNSSPGGGYSSPSGPGSVQALRQDDQMQQHRICAINGGQVVEEQGGTVRCIP